MAHVLEDDLLMSINKELSWNQLEKIDKVRKGVDLLSYDLIGCLRINNITLDQVIEEDDVKVYLVTFDDGTTVRTANNWMIRNKWLKPKKNDVVKYYTYKNGKDLVDIIRTSCTDLGIAEGTIEATELDGYETSYYLSEPVGLIINGVPSYM